MDTLISIEEAELHGDQVDSFTVSDWTTEALPYGEGGIDTVIATKDANFTLSDDLLILVPGGTFNLFSIEQALLTGGAAGNTIDASGFTGSRR